MRDIRTDGSGYDLDIVGGGLVVGEDQTVARAVRTCVETWAETYDWDLDLGMPWADLLTRRGTDLESVVADAVRSAVDPVAVVTDVDVDIDPQTRHATVTVYMDGAAPVTASVG